jgi:CMP-N-acetylneuraminic acid synthetase
MLAVVPARGGSKGLPGKNIRALCGLPLIVHTLNAAKASRTIGDVVVSTDTPEIAAVAQAEDVRVLCRPTALARDDTPMMPVVLHALEAEESRAGHQFDGVVILQPTSPLRLAEDIDGVVEKLALTGAGCVVSVCEATEHPLRAKRIVDDRLVAFGEAEPIGGLRQALPPSYRRNGAVYALRRGVLLVEDPIREGDVRPYVMPVERSVDIDTLLSFKLAEFLMAERLGLDMVSRA